MVTQHENTLVRKKQIISVAKKLILKHGSEHVTLRKMAKEIGVSEGALYRHFVSKKEILSFLLDDVENDLIFDSTNNKYNNHSALGELELILMKQISAVKQKKGMSFQIIAEIVSLGDKELSRKAYEIVNRFVKRIKETLSEGIETGEIKPNIDLDAVSVLLFGMIQGLVTIWTLSHYKLDLEQKYNYVWNLFCDSIAVNSMKTRCA